MAVFRLHYEKMEVAWVFLACLDCMSQHQASSIQPLHPWTITIHPLNLNHHRWSEILLRLDGCHFGSSRGRRQPCPLRLVGCHSSSRTFILPPILITTVSTKACQDTKDQGTLASMQPYPHQTPRNHSHRADLSSLSSPLCPPKGLPSWPTIGAGSESSQLSASTLATTHARLPANRRLAVSARQ